MTELVVGEKSELEQLLTSGSVQKATQLANAVLGTIKASGAAALTAEDKKKVFNKTFLKINISLRHLNFRFE